VFPILVDFGIHRLPLLGETHLFLPSYGFLFAVAVLLAWWWFMRRARTLDIRQEILFNLCFYSLLGGIIAAKLLLVVVDWKLYLQNPWAIFGTVRSAGVFLGGVAGGALIFIFYARHHRLPIAGMADAMVAPLALAQAIGRLGCFSAGCCWGVNAGPAALLAVTFTDPAARAQTGVPLGVPLVPIQLIEMTFDLCLVAVLTLLWRRRPRPRGTVLWIYVLLYSIGRGTIEFWRGDVHRGLYFGDALSTSQLLSAAGIVLALVMLLRGRLRRDSAAPS
jgi:phosphatidylglycerol:prolipoprotein diacylglycerol transferase